MTKLEREYLNQILRDLKIVTATSAVYDENFKRTGGVGPEEAARLMDSPDYKAGYEAAYQQAKMYLNHLLEATPEQLKRTIRHGGLS